VAQNESGLSDSWVLHTCYICVCDELCLWRLLFWHLATYSPCHATYTALWFLMWFTIIICQLI